MSDFLVIVLVSSVVAALVSKLTHWHLQQQYTRLEFELATLQERLLTEIKRRAGQTTRKAQEFDEEVLTAAKKAVAAAPQANLPWWAQYVGTTDKH